MTGDGIHDEIVRLEQRIESLRDSVVRCRKIALGAKVAIAIGLAWPLITILLATTLLPSVFFGAVAAAIGGIVLVGSNATTWNETEAALRKAEAHRAALIDSLQLTSVNTHVKPQQ